jgi:hypothetical protein
MKRFTLVCFGLSQQCLSSDTGYFPQIADGVQGGGIIEDDNLRHQSRTIKVLLRLPSASHSQLLPVRHLTFHS